LALTFGQYNAAVKERPRFLELPPELAQAYADTFLPRWDKYPLQLPNGSYVQVDKHLTLQHVIDHLTAFRYGRTPTTIGAYALNAESMARWLCLDADGEEHWQQILTLAIHLTNQDIPVYREPSRRGGHLWLFTSLLSGTDIRRFGKHLLAEAKIDGVELYPKQDKLLEGAGSFVRLPLGLHQKSNRVYTFVDHDGSPLAGSIREQIAILSAPKRVPLEYINHILSRAPEPPKTKPTKQFRRTKPKRGEPLSESLKRAVNVYQFISHFVELDAQGKGYCPFHEDEVKSFSVHTERNYWHCFAGCGGGSIIDFWMKWRAKHGEDGSFTTTVEELRKYLLK
jgi:hypothetical protein